MRTRFELFLLLLAAAAMALTGCVSSKDPTTGRTFDDRTVKTQVEQALKDEPVYKFTYVRVSTHHGVVQLSGWANSEEQKARAAELARQLDGVYEVVNKITLKPTSTGYPAYLPRADARNAAVEEESARVEVLEDGK